MKRFLLALCALAVLLPRLLAQPTPLVYSLVSSNATVTLHTNVNKLILDLSAATGGATNGIQQLNGQGTNTTLNILTTLNGAHVDTNFVGQLFATNHAIVGILPSSTASTVYIGGYDAVSTAATNLASGVTERHYLNWVNRSRIRQDGTLTTVELYTGLKPAALTAFFFEIWRTNSAAGFDRVSQEDILAGLTAATSNTVTLATPVSVIEGDYIGFGWTASSDPGPFLTTIATGDANGMYSVDSAPTAVGYNWLGQTSDGTLYVPIRCKGSTAPVIAFVGDSIMAGTPWHHNYVTQTILESRQTSVPWLVGRALGVTYQNWGHPSGTTTDIKNDLINRVIPLAPKLVVIEGGINDIVTSTNSFYANWTNMLGQCQLSNINVVVVTMLPRTANTTQNATDEDTLNSWLLTTPTLYPNVIGVFESQTLIGQFRAGGTAGNLWDIIPAYNNDNTHLAPLGYTVMARGILQAISTATITSLGQFGEITVGKDITFRQGMGPHRVYAQSSPVPETPGPDLIVQAGGAARNSTNQNGGYLYLSPGTSSGTGVSEIVFQTPTAGTTGSTVDQIASIGHIGVTVGGIGLTNSAARWTVKGGADAGSYDLFEVQGKTGTQLADIYTSGTKAGILDLFNGSGSVGVRLWGLGNSYVNSGSNFGVGTAAPANLFSVANNFQVDSTGNVGIAIAPHTGIERLALKSTGSGTGDGFAMYNSANNRILWAFAGSLGQGSLFINNSLGTTKIQLEGTNNSFINTGNNFGVGNSSPSYLLSVGSTSQLGVDSSGNVGINIAPASTSVLAVKKLNANGVADGFNLVNSVSSNVVSAYTDSSGGGDGVLDINNSAGQMQLRLQGNTISSSTAVAQVLSGTNTEFIGNITSEHAVITNGFQVNTNSLYVTNNAVGIGTVAPTHFFHIVTATNDAVAIDSTGTDSNSMLHILNTGVQGPFFDFHAANDRYGFGVGSLGAFDIRHSGVGTDPVNGTNVLTLDSAGTLTVGEVVNTNRLISIGGITYTFPATNGLAGQVLQNDGSGLLTWTNVTAAAGGTTNIMVTTISCASATLSPTFAVSGLSTTAASCRRLTMRCTLTNSVTTVSAVAGTLIDGDTMVWELIQDGTGNETITGWDTSYAFGTDITGITLSTGANVRDFITWVYNSTATKWYCVGFVRGY